MVKKFIVRLDKSSLKSLQIKILVSNSKFSGRWQSNYSNFSIYGIFRFSNFQVELSDEGR
jgi:hypothetical protein